MEDASKGPPELAADATANISEVRLDPSAAATEPCPCCGNRERCLLRPRRSLLSSGPPPLLPPSRVGRSPSTPNPRPSRATLPMRPLSPPPSPFLRSISPSFRAPLELPSAEAFRSLPPEVDPPIGHLCSDLVPPLPLSSFPLPPQGVRRLERSNSRETTPEPQERAITSLANDDTRVEDSDGRSRGETRRKTEEARRRASPGCECGQQ